MSNFVALLFAGIAEGAVYALAALSFLILYKATGVVNFAQGDLITLGAYLAIWAFDDLGLPIGIAYALAVVGLFVVGVILERLAYAPLRGRPVFVMVIATFGAATVIRALVGIWRGTDATSLVSPLQGHTFHVLGASIAAQRVAIVIAATLIVIAVLAMFAKTSLGRQFRALAADRDTARLYGVRSGRLSMLAWGISAALAGLTGVLFAPLQTVDLNLGFSLMIGGFAAAVLGGFGSLGGVVAGAMLIGIAEQVIGGYVAQNYAAMWPFVLMILVIAVRPTGLFARGATSRL